MNSAYARDDGTVRVAVERTVGLGFDHAECFLPTVNWFKVEGFSADDLDFLTEFVRPNALFIFELAERQKPDRRWHNASNSCFWTAYTSFFLSSRKRLIKSPRADEPTV